jgi:cysteine synthase
MQHDSRRAFMPEQRTNEPRISSSILDAVGNTPLIELEGIYCKLEFLNPSGSIKARIAKYIIERAEEEGLIFPGDTVVEATTGNMGNALSMVAAVKGYRMLVVTPEGFSPERTSLSQAYGAEILLSGHFQADKAVAKAKEMGEKPGYFCPSQFESEWNVEENRLILGPEILSQLPEGAVPDALVMGVGTGGTLIGVGQAFREINPKVKLFAMEPSESRTILCGEVGNHLIEGIADGFVPGIFERHQELVDKTLTIDSEEAVESMRYMAKQYGLFAGPSSGANLIAAKKVKAAYPELKTVVTLLCDEGEKYIQEYFAETDRVRVDSGVFA